MPKWFCICNLLLLFSLPESSLSTGTSQFQLLPPHMQAHRTGNFRVLIKDFKLAPTKPNKCTACDKNCQSFGVHLNTKQQWWKGCLNILKVYLANGSLGFGFGVGYGEKADMWGPVSYSDFYESLPFTGAIQRQGKLNLRILAAFDQGKKITQYSLNETYDIDLPLPSHHFGKRLRVELSNLEFNLRFTMQINIDCSPFYYPVDSCAHYTGCTEAAPCVQRCSEFGQAICDSDCYTDVGPCARSHSNSATSASTLLVSLAIPLSLVTILLSLLAGIIICKRAKQLSRLRPVGDGGFVRSRSADDDHPSSIFNNDIDSECGFDNTVIDDKEGMVDHCFAYDEQPPMEVEFVDLHRGPDKSNHFNCEEYA